MESTVIAEYLRQSSDIVLAHQLTTRSLIRPCNQVLDLLDILLQGLSHPHVLILAYLDVSLVRSFPIAGQQVLERADGTWNCHITLHLEPFHLGRYLQIYIGRSHYALELQFPSKRPLQKICTLMFERELKQCQQRL